MIFGNSASNQVLGNLMRWEEMRIVAFGDITANYTAVGNPTSPAVSLFKIVNTTDVILLFSFDNDHDHMAVPAGSSLVVDINANKSQIGHLLMGKREQLYVKYEDAAPTSGKLYFATMFSGIRAQ